MRFVPASLRTLGSLQWGQALSALGYQRVQLRLMLLSVLMTLPMLPLIVTYSLYVRGEGVSQVVSTVLLGTTIGLGLLMFVGIVLLCWAMLKVSVMRWRGLGFKKAGMVGMVVASLLTYALINVASEIGQSPELLLTGMVPLWVFHWLGLAVILQILQALFSYWQYFEETPLCTVIAPLQTPYANAPGRFESALLFLQQVWVWFSILSVPMYFVVAHLI